MFSLRRPGSSHLFVFIILLGLASAASAFGQTATLSNTSRAFGNVAVGASSAGTSFTLRNTSTTVALAISNIATSGDFSQTSTCGASVAARGNCVITVKFSPTAVGSRTGSLTISDSAGTQTASLSGTGTAPVTVTPATRSFGNVGVGSVSAAKVFTISNKSASPISFTITPGANASETDNCSSVAGGGTCTINASYAPTATGAGTGTIGISYSGAGSPLSVSISGTGIAPVTVTPATRAFGNQGVGSPSAAKTYTVSNKGTAAISVTVTPNGPFSETDNCSSVAGGATCTINGAFTPTAVGAASGGYTISYSGFGSPLTVTATGTGIAPATMTPATTAFGNVGLGSVSAAKKITVSNKGTTPIAFTIAASAGFTETDNCASVAGGGTCTVNASFAPTATGAASGTITASYSGAGSPLSVNLTGTGIGALTMTPASQAFGNVAQGTSSAARAFTITNKGTAAQALTIVASAPFTQTNTCGASLAGSSTCTINAVFAPTALGAASGTVTVNAPALTSPLSSTVTGTGVAPVTVSPATLAFSTTQNVGVASAAKSVTITNLAATALPVQSIVVSPADYTQTNNCGTSIRANNSCTVNVVFKPATAASIPGTLTINDSAVGSPQIVPLSGTGVLSTIRTLTIAPATASVAKALTLQFSVTATYTNGTTANVSTLATWTSVNPAMLAIGSTTGLATGMAVGSTSVNVSVTGSTVVGTRAVTVTPPALTAITLSPATAAVDPGSTMQYSAMGSYADNTTAPIAMNTLVLSSDKTTVATINAAGLAFGVNGGVASIKAVSGAITSPAVPLTVNGPVLQTITIAPAAGSFAKGTTQQFTATGKYSDATTKDLSTAVVWGSGNANLTISNLPGTQGLATGVTAGPAIVNASWNGGAVLGTTTATVLTAPLASIVVTPASITVGIGAQQQYAATAIYADNTQANITNSVTWGTGNSALVGINAAGLATVFGTSDQAVPVTATSGTIVSNPPAFINALSTLPRVCSSADVDMKVLVIDNAAKGYADLPAIKQILEFVGTPYTVMQYTDVTPAVLSDGTCHGYFQSIIMAFGDDIYSGNANLFTTLNSYETTFHVRQLNWFFNPTPDYGFNYSASSVPSTSTYTANFTAAAATVFPNINTATPLTFSGAFIFLSPQNPPVSGTVTPLLTDASGHILSAIYTSAGGPEVLSQTFDSNQYLKHNLVLAYGLLNWVTKGVFLGDYHVYAAAQVDDFFINDAEWVPGTPCTNPTTHDRTVSDDPSLPTFRLKAADMTALVAWQNNLQNDPMFTGFKLTMAFNGVGTVGNKDWTGLPLDGVANDDLVTSLPSYEQYFHWITHTYDHPNTLNGLHQSDGGGDLDNHPGVDSIDLEILTNLFVANGTGQMLDLDPSDNTAPAAVATLHFTDFNPASMVSPGVTGLNDAVVPQFLFADGIRYVVSDTSVLNTTNNGPNPSPNVGIVNSFAPGIYEVPRYPNSIYYNAANWADDEAEFHCIYGPTPGPSQPPYDSYAAPQILDYTTDTFVVNMLKGDMDPQMFHQPNLHAYDGVNSLISDVYNQTFSKYKALYKLPVLSLTLDQLAEAMKARNNYNLAGATGTILGVGTAAPSVSVTVPPANPGAVISITGLASNGSELYGGTKISHIQINQGETVQFPLQ